MQVGQDEVDLSGSAVGLIWISKKSHIRNHTGGTMRCPKKHVNEVFITWRHLNFSLKYPKIEHFHSRFVSRFKIDHVTFSLKCPLFCVRKPWNASFSHPILKIGKWDISRFSNIKKWDILGKKHVTWFLNNKEPKMKFINFGAFWEKIQMPSHDKILLHMLFGAFHGTSRKQFCKYYARDGIFENFPFILRFLA